MKKFYAIALALLFMGCATVVFAAPPEAGPDCPQGFHGQWGHHGFAALKLKDEQKAKLRAVRERYAADFHDLRYNIAIKKIEARKLFTDPKADDATLLAKEKELNTLVYTLMTKKAEMKVEWRKVLTPEQISMLDRIPWRHHGHHGWGHDGGHHGPAAPMAMHPMAAQPQGKPVPAGR
jgi:Spy/CpxP family protein refolding chaperone